MAKKKNEQLMDQYRDISVNLDIYIYMYRYVCVNSFFKGYSNFVPVTTKAFFAIPHASRIQI